MKQALILLGASGHAKVVIDLLEQQENFELIGILDKNRSVGTDYMGYPILGEDDWIERETAAFGVTQLLPGIGSNWQRSLVYKRFCDRLPEVAFASAIHPSAKIGKGVEIGAGTVIMAGAILNSGAKVGQSCVVNSGAILEHDSVMADFSSLGPAAVVGGNCEIGSHSYVGLGARIIHGRRIGAHTVIGAGATVIEDMPELVVSYGNPARVIRARFENEDYL